MKKYKDYNTLLIIGGIHGDEPGGYFAPAVLEKYYKIKSGNLWIIPNLNVDSITIIAALLHETINHGNTTKEELEENFSKEVADIVDTVSKINIQLVHGYGICRMVSLIAGGLAQKLTLIMTQTPYPT